ncbi:carbohydrate-binding domain-containing protein [Nocardioides sp. GY 10113]|uniref:carbohydrate-binding domain-containing protein n=1 Tax=Nocardioides sp. GY 10113 TaxID=2569761 RepID=UPI0010A7D57B|nr:carbohydrate-binding domain-containing protein [Nocardioides sp. GY 10113]TIC86331.1 carbohydrate-binding domain-containing protein [Nocardioides sp. GY 10113]
MKNLVRTTTLAGASAVALLSLSACSTDGAASAADAGAASASAVPGDAQELARGSSNYVTTLEDTHADADDGEYDADGATTITLADGASSVDGSGAELDGDVVTITDPGTYLVSGTLTDGQLVVDSAADGKVRVVLDGADITSASSSPVWIKDADEAVLILADGSSNSLSDAKASGEDDEEDDAPNATVYSTADLTIAGAGSLEVTGVSADGITGKDGLVVLSGTIDVTAADDAITGKDYLGIEGGTITVTAEDDGIKAANEDEADLGSLAVNGGTITVAAGDDGLKAEGALTINDGTITVTRSEESIEAADIVIAGGTVDVTANDDGINVAGPALLTESTESTGSTGTGDSQPPADGERPERPAGDMGDMGDMGGGPGGPMGGMGGESDTGGALTISGGDVTVTAEGDGLDSNGSLAITGGTVVVNGPESSGNGAIDVNGSYVIDGGTVYAGGSAGMLEAPDTDSGQAWLVAALDSTVAAGSTIEVQDDDGTTVGTFTTTKATGALVVSTADLRDSGSYRFLADGQQVATATAGEFTGGGMGGMGGMGGGPQG